MRKRKNEKRKRTRKEEREGFASFLVRDSQKRRRKTSRNRRMQATLREKAPRIFYACTALTHILEVRPEI
jgi:DNA primase catalytic subunit